MRQKFGWAFASVISLAVAGIGAASAADLAARPYTKAPPPAAVPVFSWTGFYIGVNGGYGWSAFSDQLQDLSNGPGNLFSGLSPKGGFGGGQVGYNWQAGYFVFGLEADAQASAIRDQVKWTLATSTSKLDWFGTVRGRAGIAVDRVLFYATGGWAYGHVANSEIGGIAYTSSADSSGYALGGGIEYAFTNNWSVKGEYQYLNFGRHDPTTVTGVRLSSFPGVIVREDAFHTVRVGINYRFGGPVVANY